MFTLLEEYPNTPFEDANATSGNNIDYVVVTCKDGKFDIGTVLPFDIYGVTCKHRMEPRITKIFNEDQPCADTGADGRKDDLRGHLHTVEIGFKIRDDYSKMVSNKNCMNVILFPAE